MLPPNFKTWVTAVVIAILVLLLMIAAQTLPYVSYLFGRAFIPVKFAEEDAPVISIAPLPTVSTTPSPKPLDPPPPIKPTNYTAYASPPLRPADSVKPNEVAGIFMSVYGRQPSASELRYWTGRLSDKPQRTALIGAMQFHLDYRIRH